MEKIAIIGCGAYMDSGYGCAGEWRCLKAAALGEGEIEEPSSVVIKSNQTATLISSRIMMSYR
ncbi:MAG: hypothetical protein MUO88_06590 [Desulfobacterales bacterium]|nr:hypothetical protein [Desulfobacterales bacterium]